MRGKFEYPSSHNKQEWNRLHVQRCSLKYPNKIPQSKSSKVWAELERIAELLGKVPTKS